MESWIRVVAFIAMVVVLGMACGKDEKSSADKAAEVQKAIQEGIEKERKMYEGMQKGVEGLEKSVREQKTKEKK
jgi:hypothetical protein